MAPIAQVPNAPLHSPLYRTVNNYASKCSGFSILMEIPKHAVEQVLAPTPLEFLSPHVWVEMFKYETPGLEVDEDPTQDQYMAFTASVPAKFGDVTGSYTAVCYKNKDYGIAMGREVFGFPIKYAKHHFQKTGNAVAGTVVRPTANFAGSVVVGAGGGTAAPGAVVHSPTFLYQVIPSGDEENTVLLEQLYSRDVSATSDMQVFPGEGAIDFLPTVTSTDELAWLHDGRIQHAEYFTGIFRGNLGRVLSTKVSAGLRDRIVSN